MTIPETGVTMHAVMRLIGAQPDHSIEAGRAIALLTPQFPLLTHAEKTEPFHTSRSHFVNRVQTAVNDLKKRGWLEWGTTSGTGIWRFTPKARAKWRDSFLDGDELLAEMMNGLHDST